MDMRRTLLCLVVVLAAAAPAQGAGMTTHAHMAEAAVGYVQTPALSELLRAQGDAVLAGAAYPDGGYASSSFPGGNYGEESHWQRFVDAYLARLRGRGDCTPLTAPDGPCAKQVAHMLGVAAHGMGDELWDWLFEPAMADHGESPTHPVFTTGLPGFAELGNVTPFNLINTSEYVMDVIALIDGGRLAKLGTSPPPFEDLLAAYAAVGRGDVTREGITAGNSLAIAAQTGERPGLPAEYLRVKTTMPWSSANMFGAPGGVFFSGRAIAAYYESLWHRLATGTPAPLRVANVNPAHGATGVTTDFQGRVQTSPGPNGGGAGKRIVAAFSSAIRPETVTAETFRLYDEDGESVAPMTGWPRMGPYGPEAGEHTLMFYPAQDLRPCTSYTAELTPGIRDWTGQKLDKPSRWSFETAC